MKHTQQQVSRFLMQATLGADQKLIDSVSQQGIEKWLANEFKSTPSLGHSYESTTREIWHYFRSKLVNAHGQRAIDGDGNNPALPYKWYFHMAWWQKALENNENLLRHRVAQALSEILVISDNSVLELDAIGMASYYDLLYKHAFGSYADLLYDVSMHPCMGVYLSHMNNRKADPSQRIHPDENYAREIMQLFSIGLYQLNPDGTRKTNQHGHPIATYDNRDIKELARVFTGLKAASYQFEWENSFWSKDYNGYQVNFEDGIDKRYKTIPFVNMTQPMEVEESYHDRQDKSLLNGHISLRRNTSAQQEIRTVVNKLVSYPSTAPFIATKLINQLVTSNPSAEYVEAVAVAFGPQGNLKNAIHEILTYPLKHPVGKVRFLSATVEHGTLVQSQKLKSPVLRVTQLLRAFNASNQSKKLWVIGDDIEDQLEQHPLSSPTVFNFYKPSYTPHGPIEDSGLVAPEFELHNSATSIAYVNYMYYWLFGGYLPAVSTEISRQPGIHNVAELDIETLQANKANRLKLNFAKYIGKAQDPSNHGALIDEISLLLTGKTQLSIKPQILSSFAAYKDQPEWVVQTIVFFIAISSEFTVQEA